jgi:predicted nuclease of restriction endonuclease-like (RecB) superfamily
MSRKKTDRKPDTIITKQTALLHEVDEAALFERITAIIENRKYRAAAHANQETTLMFWEIGEYINQTVLDSQRAAYGKKILTELAAKLMARYGNNFSERNLYRMTLFAERFTDAEILPPLAAKLSWSHFIELLPLKDDEARIYYATSAAALGYGTKELRRQISRKAYERREIADTELGDGSVVPFNVFKDPYLLDMFGLKDNYLEADLEKAILEDIKAFFLEFGHGFAYVDSQKRMIVDGEDIELDLLFYHREIKRLVAVELKLGRFKAAYMGQMLLYLKWLDKYERKDGEEAPIGIILCATANREKVELLEMDKAGIAVAEYWTHLPPKAEFEARIKAIMVEAKERLERRKSLPASDAKKVIDYFLEEKGEEDE